MGYLTTAGDDPEADLAGDIRRAIHRHSAEKTSDTPDHILAGYLVGCLNALDEAIKERDAFYGVKLAPGQGHAETLAQIKQLQMWIWANTSKKPEDNQQTLAAATELLQTAKAAAQGATAITAQLLSAWEGQG